MVKRLLLFLGVVASAIQASAQSTVSGSVFEFEKKTTPLEKVYIRNLSSKIATTTNEKGQFTVAAKAGDLLEFNLVGFMTDTLFLIDLKPKHVFLLPRTLDVDAVEIKGVKISPYLDWKDPNAKEYKRIATDDLRNKENTDRAGGINLSLGYGKYRREKAKLAQLTEQEMYEDEIKQYFNEKTVYDLVKLKGQDLKDFMEMYRPTTDQVKFQRPFNYKFYIATAYHA